MIIKKEWFGKERLTVEFRSDIHFIYSVIKDTDKDIIITFSDKMGKCKNLLEVTSCKSTFEEIDPDVVFSFTNPQSIQNLIDSLLECKNSLEHHMDTSPLFNKKEIE